VQVIVAVPKRERSMQRALPRVHCECLAGVQMGGGGRAGIVGLAVEPEGRGVELNDRRLGPALRRIENGLDAPVEA
jgi:hypothetical protein